MRFLYKEKTRHEALEYLQDLKPEEDSSIFYQAYINNNGKWQTDIAAAEACRRKSKKKSKIYIHFIIHSNQHKSLIPCFQNNLDSSVKKKTSKNSFVNFLTLYFK
jgi:hypothetical protein